jgi:Vitamin K-dependent gamma-carboxylase
VDSALDPQPPDRPYPAIPFAAIRLQIVSLYFVSAIFKLEGAPWRSGKALIWALSDTAYGATPAGLFLVHHLPGLLYIVNYSVIAFQLAFPFLVYWPWRNDWTRAFALLGAACRHVSFLVCLNIGSFPFLSLAVLILMVPDPWIDRLLLRRRMRLQHITLYHEPRCELCQRILLVLREFLLPRAAKILSASHDPEALRLLDAGQSWAVRATGP